jgi:hypothetical protein
MFAVEQIFICNTSEMYLSWERVAKIFVKKIPHQQCNVKGKYTKEGKSSTSQVLWWTQIKYKTLYFSCIMHCFVKQEYNQPK